MQTLVIHDDYSAECNNMHYSSFGWGDMPYQGEHGYFYEGIVLSTTNNPMLPESFFRLNSSTNTPSLRTAQHSLSAVSHQHQHDHIMSNSNNTAIHNHTAPSRKRQRIRFAEQVQVRTHETILGYHPACTDGLALQCGWAYAETEYTPLSCCSNTVSKKSVREMRLDQMTRRQRLREVTGMSNLQLLQLANELLDVDSFRKR